jgi:hypothetical protein
MICKNRLIVPEKGPQKGSMLLTFRAANARSFRDEFEFSMLATARAEPRVVRQVNWREGGQPLRVLPVSGIFGANGSGKSNVLEAMDDMRFYVVNSFRRTGEGVPRWPFRLDPDFETRPSTYEIDLVLGSVRYEYGLVLDNERVLEEWAVHYPHGKAARLFSRKSEAVEPGSSARALTRSMERLLRPNALFLSTAAAANHPLLKPLYEWFQRNLLSAVAANRAGRQAWTVDMLDRSVSREQILALLRASDLGIVDAHKLEADPALKERLARALRAVAREEGKPLPEEANLDFSMMDGFSLVHHGATGDVEFQPDEESLGTLVWLGLIGPLVGALSGGSVLLADELDASLHPALVHRLIELFQQPETNPNRAQLIFNSHDPTLLGDPGGHRLLGRDQTWFTEKRIDGSTRLFPLLDLDPRKHEAVGRRYLEGRYGATPVLSGSDFDRLGELIAVDE